MHIIIRITNKCYTKYFGEAFDVVVNVHICRQIAEVVLNDIAAPLFLTQALEKRIAERGYHKIYLETAAILKEAVNLYTSAGYKSVSGVECALCDLRMCKTVDPRPMQT